VIDTSALPVEEVAAKLVEWINDERAPFARAGTKLTWMTVLLRDRIP
jgi:hypothetical protein